MLVVPDGPVIALWLDDFDGFVFTRQVEGEWEPPKAVEFPFIDSETIPWLVADGQGKIHAFWLAKENTLYYSSVVVESFGTDKWTNEVELDEGVTDLKVTVNAQGDLNLLYVRTVNTEEEFPIGVYFIKRVNAQAVWTPRVLLYPSFYMRVLPEEEITLELISVSSSVSSEEVEDSESESETQETLYAVWDNRLQSQIFFSISEDAGETWGEPVEIRGPESASAPPTLLGATRLDEQIQVMWQESVSENNCRQFYQMFSLTGEMLTPPQVMLSKYPVCPDANQLIPLPDGVLLQTTLFSLNYLLAWDGTEWSEPQLQSELSSFINPDTLEEFELKCIKTMAAAADKLLMIGCDKDETAGDVWFTSREVSSFADWYLSPSSWNPALSFFSTQKEISSVSLLADAAGQLHAIWMQSAAEGAGDVTFFYARWDGTQWAPIVSIITPPFGRAQDLSAALDPSGRLIVVWSGGPFGEIYFSWTSVEVAGMPSEWAEPAILPMPRPVGATPQILAVEDGRLYVTYAIPINEHRGIYLISSTDRGETWSEPVQVVDGSAAGWEMVMNPTLEVTPSGDLHLLFWRFPPPVGVETTTLYYVRSTDQGTSWTAPEELVSAELRASWIESFGQEAVYRMWQEIRNGVLVTILETSVDGGVTWSAPINFSDFDLDVANSDVVLAPSGRLHVLQLVKDSAGLILQEKSWDGANWVNENRQRIEGAVLEKDPWLLKVRVNSEGTLGVLVIGQMDTAAEGSSDIVFTSRKLEESAAPPPLVTPVSEVVVPEQTATPDLSVTPTAAPDGTPTVTADRETTSQPTLDGTILGPVVGLVVSGFLVVLAFFVITRLTNRNG
jgi:hypothetical protein